MTSARSKPLSAPPAVTTVPSRKRPWLLYVGLAFVAVAAWPAYRRVEAFRLLEQGARELAADDFAAAQLTYAKLAIRQPTRAEAHFRWGIASRRGRNYLDAAQHFDEAERLGHSEEELQAQRNMLRFEAVGDPAAEKFLLRRIRDGVDDEIGEQVLESLSIGCLNAQRMLEARQHLTEWARWRPGLVRPILLRGKANLELRRFREAADDLRIAVKDRPADVAAHSQLADVLFAIYQYEEAEQHYQEAEKLSPGLVSAALGHGRCANELGKSDEAQKILERVATLEATDGQKALALVELARIELAGKKADQARALLERALALREDDINAHNLLATLLARAGETAAAEKHRERSEELNRDLKKLAELQAKVQTDPQNPELLYEIGKQALVCYRSEEALAWLEAALRKAPRVHLVHESLAECFLRLGQPDLAKKHRELAVQLAPPVPVRKP